MIKCDRCEDQAWYMGDDGYLCRTHFTVMREEKYEEKVENLKAQVEMLERDKTEIEAICCKKERMILMLEECARFYVDNNFPFVDDIGYGQIYVGKKAKQALEKLKQMRGSDEN